MTVVADFRERENVSNGEKQFVISCIPAIEAMSINRELAPLLQSRDVLAFSELEEHLILRILKYTAIKAENDDGYFPLDSAEVINRRLSPFDIVFLVTKMYDKNFGFFADGRFRALLEAQAQAQEPKK